MEEEIGRNRHPINPEEDLAAVLMAGQVAEIEEIENPSSTEVKDHPKGLEEAVVEVEITRERVETITDSNRLILSTLLR